MNKQILPLLLIALLGAGVAVWLTYDKQPQRQEASPLFPELREIANSITGIRLRNSSGYLFSAQLSDDIWLADIAGNGMAYPAAQESLSSLVNQLADVRLHEAKTRKAENHSRLGLADITSADSQATLIELIAPGKQFSVLIGNSSSSGNGSYARLPGKEQTWLLDGVITLPLEPQEWLKQPVFDFADGDVVSLSRTGEQGWNAVRASDNANGFIIDALPESRVLKYDSIVDGLIGNLTGLRFDDVLLEQQTEWPEASQINEFTLILKDSLIEFRLASLGEEYLLQASSSKTETPYWHDVVYKVSGFAYNQLNKTLEDFLAPLESEQQMPPVAIDEGEAPGE